MIITRISGGLGNQMFQYAIAKSLAKRNNDVFKLDLPYYTKQTLRKYELNLFSIDENIASEDECIKLRGKEGLLYKVLNKCSEGRSLSYTLTIGQLLGILILVYDMKSLVYPFAFQLLVFIFLKWRASKDVFRFNRRNSKC